MRIFDSQFWATNGVLTPSKRSQADADASAISDNQVIDSGPKRVLNVLILSPRHQPDQV
jgi:hypothetical protein